MACVVAALGMMLLPSACSSTEEGLDREYSNTPRGNFMALWEIMDERYCYFDLKKEVLGVDWNEVKLRYSASISGDMSNRSLFEVLCKMIGELRDGHVNLSSAYDFGRNWSWKTDYPANYSKDLQDKYLGLDYVICGNSSSYRILDDNIGYMVVESFESSISNGSLNAMFNHMALCNGLIIDIRDNGGGLLTDAETFAARFTNSEILVGYMQHKTGTGHNDFSKLEEQRLKPSNGVRWQKRVILLTNRQVYSSANEFTKYMKCCPQVTIVGDQTGGGGGLPFTSELPNGWGVRFSACPMYDRDKQSTEFGIAPDHHVDMTQEDFLRGKDTIIEYARDLLNK